jgi:AcrR family transcriptional regulator
VSTREEQKQKRRALIVEKAKELFLEHGIQDVQLQDIAKEVGIGIATFYRYFPNKELLVIAVNNEVTIDMTEAIKQIVEKPISAFEQLEAVLDYFIEKAQDPEMHFVRFVKAFDAYRPTNQESEEYAEYLYVRKLYANELMKIAEKGKEDMSVRTDLDLNFTIFTLVQNISHFVSESKLTVHDPNLPIDLNANKQVELLKEAFLNFVKQ